jgi:periplasmic protein CpxP/Spy
MTSSRVFRSGNAGMLAMTVSSFPFSTAAIFVAPGAWQRMLKEFSHMKKALACAFLSMAMTLCGTALYAQMQDGAAQGGAMHPMGPMSTDQRMQHLTQMLNLTSDQQAKIRPILDNEAQQMQALRADTSMAREDKMGKMRSIRETTNSQIKPILTTDQQQKWQQAQTQMHQHSHDGVAPNAVGPGGEMNAPPPPQQ